MWDEEEFLVSKMAVPKDEDEEKEKEIEAAGQAKSQESKKTKKFKKFDGTGVAKGGNPRVFFDIAIDKAYIPFLIIGTGRKDCF